MVIDDIVTDFETDASHTLEVCYQLYGTSVSDVGMFWFESMYETRELL